MSKIHEYEVTFYQRDGQPPVRKIISAVSPQQALYKFAYGYGFKAAYSLWDRVKNASKSDRLRITQVMSRDLFIHD